MRSKCLPLSDKSEKIGQARVRSHQGVSIIGREQYLNESPCLGSGLEGT